MYQPEKYHREFYQLANFFKLQNFLREFPNRESLKQKSRRSRNRVDLEKLID
mgnify:CR=1 FL=1